MKKVIFILATIAILTSCEEVTHEQWQQEHDKKVASHITKFNYEGHTYLLYEVTGGSAYSLAGICHDENCPCKSNNQSANGDEK